VNITFRTDASHQIGTGHVVRCLTLASALRDRGAKCRFVCREHTGHLLDLIRKQGFEAIGLSLQDSDVCLALETDTQPLEHAAWLGTDWATDAEQTKVCTGESAIDWLIVDHYALDARWESVMRRQCRKLMVIDDLADRLHDCDLLLDQNLFSDMSERYIGKVPVQCGQMLGPHYALLQHLYGELHPRIPPREGPVRRILVYFGGADTNNLTGIAIAAYRALAREDLALDVVINPSSPHAEIVRRQIDGHTTITLYEGLPTLAPLMAHADLAIGAGGATSWERCCLGLPSIVITLAANQIPIACEMERLGLIQYLGDASEVNESTLVSALKHVCATGLTTDWLDRCHQKVDGRGTDRVASILMLNSQSKLKPRLARVDDEALMWQWANDSLVRRNAFASNPIDQSTHRDWFRRHLRDLERCRIYVVETEDNIPIGQVRFDLIEKSWEIDYSLDELARGRGLGEALLQSAMQALRSSMTGVLLFGRVKTSNQASCRIFESLGFLSENAGGGGEIVYRHLF
jgi:UDP-2,4-diacetamido-2,4,6-trideoxy-beta-L-altropyranose hydrolase